MEFELESLKCEVIIVGVGLVPYPSFVRLIVVWLCALPLSVEVIFVGERSCVLPNCICPKSSVEVPCVGSPVWTS